MGALCVVVVCLAALTACKIQLRTATATATGPGTTIPLTIARGSDGSTLALLAVTINGHGPFQFALDTGASSSLIDRTLTSQLSLPVAGPPQTIAGVSSKETATPVKVAKWSIGKLTLPSGAIDSAALFDSRQSDSVRGLLGSDIWSQFGRITIDYGAGTLTVYSQTTGLRSAPSKQFATARRMLAMRDGGCTRNGKEG
ncbi:MAG: retropepsin-like aspartic protease [Ktedonobacterales bacterium]